MPSKLKQINRFGLIIAMIIVITIPVFSPPFAPSASAQTTPAPTTVSGVIGNVFTSPVSSLPIIGPAIGATQIGAAAGRAAAGQPVDTLGCFSGGNGVNASLCISNIVYIFTVGLGSALAYVGAYFFDTAVSLALNSAAYALDFIATGWTVARDLANMGFILALVYLAYTIMLKAETSNTMQMLAWIIFVALIINFSFFFTRLIIDAGNILAVQFYNAIQAPPLSQTISTPTGQIAGGTANYVLPNTLNNTKDLTHSIMAGLNMQGLFSNAQFGAQSTAWFNGSGFLTVVITLSFLYITVGAMYFILAVMFLTAGVKFLVRIVILWFLIIASPLAFLAKTTTLTTQYYDRWQKLLIAHTFYPVVFLFIFLFISLFMNGLNQNGGIVGGIFGQLGNLSANNTVGGISYLAASIANVAIRMGFVIAMLYIGMRIADTVGVYGGSAAAKITNWASGAVRTGLRYGPGWAAGAAYRNTVALGANALSKGVTGSQWANRTGTLRGAIGYRLNKNILKPVQETSLGTVASSFKERGTFLETRRKEMDKNLGDRDDRIKLKKEAAELAKIDTEWGPLEKRVKELESDTTPISPIQEAFKVAEIKDKKEQLDKLRPQREQLINNISKSEGNSLLALKASDIEGIIKHISDKQVKTIKESLKFTQAEKLSIEKKWHEESKKAPLAESKEQIKKIQDSYATLKTLGVNISKLQETVSPPHGTEININLGTAKALKKNLEEEMDKQEDIRDDRSLDDAAGKAKRAVATRAAKALKKAIEHIGKLEEQVKNVPKDTGKVSGEGQFIHSQ